MAKKRRTPLREGASAEGRFLMQRRDFVRLGSFAVAGLAATGLADDAVRGVAGAFYPPALPLLSIGYWNGSFDDPASNERIVAADSLSSGDSRFTAAGARLRLAGFWRAEHHRAQPLSININVHYPVAGSDSQKVAFMAWTCVSRRGGVAISNPLAIDVPLGAERALELSVRATGREGSLRKLTRRIIGTAQADNAQPVEQSVARLSIAEGSRLRRGVYFLAVRESENDRIPNWGAIRVTVPANGTLSPGSPGPLHVATIGGPRAVPFSYLVVSTAYAGS